MKIRPQLVISPMAGVSDAPFRHMALKYGADYGVSEMISSQTQLWDTPKTQQRLKTHFKEPRKIIQIAGASPEVVVTAAKACAHMQLDALEINMGCPAKKVCNVLAGSALLRDEGLVAKILNAVVSAVDFPVYLKTRLGWDQNNLNILRIAKIAEDAGISSLTIHGRSRCELYNGTARYDLIAAVKDSIHIPVFANGDITTPKKALEVWQQTASDGLYIGRGALGRPWLFQQIKDYFTSGEYMPVSSWEQVKASVLEHISLIHQHYGPDLGVTATSVLIARKHVKWYLKNPELGLDGAKLFAPFSQLLTASEQLDYLNLIST